MKPLLTMNLSDSIMPIRKPDATIAGMIGTKMSPRVLIARWNQLPFCAACALASSLLTADAPDCAMNCSNTLLTVPVPKMICNCPWASNTPCTPVAFSSAGLSTFLLSAITSRRRVAQCAAETTFSFPPMLLSTSEAAFA